MRITSKGQVTIPVEIRERLGLLPETEVEFEISGNAARIRRKRRQGAKGDRLIARLRGRGTVKMTTDEILSLTRR
jgi:AbrB family looped-hinge helix DNA binding protein